MNNKPDINQPKLFETIEGKAEDIIDPLIPQPYSYENIVQNPVIKPIAEADRSLRDLDELINKKLVDMKRDNAWINQAFSDVLEYQDSSFVSRLVKFGQDSQDVIKLQDLELRNLKNCIRDIWEIIQSDYGKLLDEEGVGEEQETKIPEGSYRGYLDKLAKSDKPLVGDVAKSIIEIYEQDVTNKDDRIKFALACQGVYNKETDKSTREIIGKIIRTEIER